MDLETALQTAVRSGALVRFHVELEEGELGKRRLWVRPQIETFLKSRALDEQQVQFVRAPLRRFVVGGHFTVVTARCTHREVESIGDIRELKGDPLPFIEFRFRLRKYDLRMFGRFVAHDSLVLTTYGLKSLTDKTGRAKLSIPDERKRCDDSFKAAGLRIEWVLPEITECISNARFFV